MTRLHGTIDELGLWYPCLWKYGYVRICIELHKISFFYFYDWIFTFWNKSFNSIPNMFPVWHRSSMKMLNLTLTWKSGLLLFFKSAGQNYQIIGGYFKGKSWSTVIILQLPLRGYYKRQFSKLWVITSSKHKNRSI